MKESKTANNTNHKKQDHKKFDHKKTKPPIAHNKSSAASNQANAEEVTIGAKLVITVKRIGINGEGVGYYRRKAVFIDGVLPGEVVQAEATEVNPSFIKAKVRKIEKKSADRVQPSCSVYEKCGGCQLQHMSYAGQLKAKEELVREALERYTGLKNLPIKPTIGMDQPWAYRNKAQLQVAERNEELLAGLYEMGSHEVVDISGCPIQHSRINETVQKVKAILSSLNINVYNKKLKQGIRSLVVRYGFKSEQLQLTIVSATEQMYCQDEFIQLVREQLPDITSIALNVNAERTSLIFGDKTIILWGEQTIQESLGRLKFSLSPRAFFQLNPSQTVKLYDLVLRAANLTGHETVVDAYCGTGTIGLWLAPYAKEVIGVEVIPEAVEDARRNAKLNKCENVTFHVGEAETLLPRWVKSGLTPDVIVVDPPRTGLDYRFIQTILQVKPKRFVYVSCNPSTLAKDCKHLLENGYELQSVQPVDMFPNTSHVESVALLVKDGTED